jgi:hypothetical protein
MKEYKELRISLLSIAMPNDANITTFKLFAKLITIEVPVEKNT